MQLDRTGIAIRQRSTLELFDLSLLVIKRYWRPILASSLLVALPLLLIDSLLVQWMLGEQAQWASESFDDPMTVLRWRRSAHLVALVCLQFPLASLPTVVLLGSLVFYEPLSMRQLRDKLLPIAWRCIWVLGICRLGLVAMALEPLVRREMAFDWVAELFILILLPIWGLTLRGFMPFASEILGLELCPLRSQDKSVVTYRRRSRRLHSYLASEHLGRLIVAGGFAILLLLMTLGLQLWLSGILAGVWQWSWWCDYVGLPVSLWILGLYFTVFRFLAYLDSRIRLEGWELELRMRAEADRIEKKPTVMTGSASEPLVEHAAHE